MANAPLVGQDGGSYKDDLPDVATEIFFFEGLDRFLQPQGDLPVVLICRKKKADFKVFHYPAGGILSNFGKTGSM